MRLITWNFREGFARKAQKFFDLDPDIAVVPEYSRHDALTVVYNGYSSLSFGDRTRRKGVAVFHRSEWKITLMAEPKYKWVVL